MLKFTKLDKMPIPLEAIEDFKKTLWVDAYFKLTKKVDGAMGIPAKKIVYDFYIKSLNPHIVVGRDGSSLSYAELMQQCGWWEQHKWEYFVCDEDSAQYGTWKNRM